MKKANQVTIKKPASKKAVADTKVTKTTKENEKVPPPKNKKLQVTRKKSKSGSEQLNAVRKQIKVRKRSLSAGSNKPAAKGSKTRPKK